jgi:hypothetical protein
MLFAKAMTLEDLSTMANMALVLSFVAVCLSLFALALLLSRRSPSSLEDQDPANWWKKDKKERENNDY